ncbi:[NiFe]-hydrogenase assembly chaperone HybE [Azonexus fungiphilus]|uniref:[NiFe]-hydrogenase assembly chaperone HybE n=1 Tax=Azonexus fungiphilus TaxID=146940 RepID=UPI001B877169|nr:[NiFe]-hydrogenase assembly chaperone HybE [Azonexus fungiphilus]
MKIWPEDPSTVIVAVFSGIAATRMAGLPICNPALAVEAIGFRQADSGHWVGALVTPWAINLLCLPGHADWPAAAAGSHCDWAFPSGVYEFIVADEASLGRYHLCSLFSPAGEFASHEQARLTALAAITALFNDPLAAPPAPVDAAPAGRRAFLGLRG